MELTVEKSIELHPLEKKRSTSKSRVCCCRLLRSSAEVEKDRDMGVERDMYEGQSGKMVGRALD